jgi:hypothetical protein
MGEKMTTKQLTTKSALVEGHDAPITASIDDLLDATKIANAIHRTILNAPKNWSTRIGLFGSWGSGKTSILNLLERLEKDDGSIVVRLSAWSAAGEAGILHLLYSELTKQLHLHNIKAPKIGAAKNFAVKAKGFGRIGKYLGRGAEIAGQLPAGTSDVVAGAAESAFAWLSINKRDVDALVTQLNGRRVVIFVDDLDRADPRLIPKTLLALRELLDWPGFSFVLAFDRKVVARALTEYSAAYGENAQTFLEKVVDIPFEISPPNDAQKFALATQSFGVCCPFLPDSALASGKQYLPKEPRRVKLIARKIGVLKNAGKRHGPDEIDWFGLLLHQIIQEASPEAASFVVDAATSRDANWLLWSGDEAEKKAKDSEFRTEIRNRMLANNSPSDERVILAALALLAHWAYTSSEAVNSLVNLVFDEPTFTKKEFLELFFHWTEVKESSVLVDAIEHGARVANVSIESSAQDLLSLAINQYAETLSCMAEAESDISWQALAKDAEARLSFLEHLWSPSAIKEIQEASRTEIASSRLIEVVTHWIGWDRNLAERPLREREKVLALKAAVNSNAQDKIYSGMDPYWNGGNPFGVTGKTEWIALVRETLSQPVCERLIARFRLPGELLNIVRSEESLALWLLESVKSPIYAKQHLADQLVSVLRGDATTDAIARACRSENSRTYLHLLLGQARNASWGGIEKIREIYGRYPSIIQASWDAVASCPVPFRMASAILKLRTDLVAAGVPENQLGVPSWLALIAADLGKDASPVKQHLQTKPTSNK